MTKIALLFFSVLVSSLTMGEKLDPGPESLSGMVVVKRDAKSFHLIYKAAQKSDVKVEILDDRNSLVYSEVIRNSDGFRRPYNFEGLRAGAYTIRLDNGSRLLTETVSFNFENNEIPAQLIRIREGKYLLTVPGKGQEVLHVKVLDNEGNMVHENLIRVSGDFAQVYNVEKNMNFSLEVTDSNGHSRIFSR